MISSRSVDPADITRHRYSLHYERSIFIVDRGVSHLAF
jgi:hypothetical protein